jgi:hypothetical protein
VSRRSLQLKTHHKSSNSVNSSVWNHISWLCALSTGQKEMDQWVARSRSFLEGSEQFLAGFDKTAQPNGPELSPIAPRAKTVPPPRKCDSRVLTSHRL